MKFNFKRISLILVIAMLITALVGCGSTATSENTSAASSSVSQTSTASENTAPDISKKVDLKIYCVGDASPGEGSNLVRDAVNKVIESKINATISTEYLPWSDWTNKYQLVFASGEEFDGIYTANWAYYQAQATKNGFKEITKDDLQKYAPKLLTDLPEMAWDQAKINGKIYMIPTTFSEFPTVHFTVREDLKKKYNVPDITDLDSFGAYLDAIAKNEKSMVPLDISVTNNYSDFQQVFNTQNEYGVVGNVSERNFVYKITEPGATIVNVYETPEFMAFAKKMYQWKQAGYWSKNAISNKTPNATAFENGKSAALLTNALQATNYSEQWPAQHPGWEVQVYDSSLGKKQIGTPYIGSGLGIHATSKNADRLLMFAELARTDKDLNQLLCYGIKDTHWQLVGDNKVKYIRGNTKVDYTDGLSWFFRNEKFQLNPTGVYSNYDPIFEAAKKNQISHVLQAFNFDDSKLKNEVAAVSSVVTQYAVPIITGFMDPETGIPTLNEKMKAAGADKIMAAIKEQADKFIAESK